MGASREESRGSSIRDSFEGRQPLLNRAGRVVAYESLFRDAADAATAALLRGEGEAGLLLRAVERLEMGSRAEALKILAELDVADAELVMPQLEA